jgi:hypothetical protein
MIKNILYNLYRMSIKTNCIISLFAGLAIILAINPKVINNVYNNVFGRIVLLAVIIFLSMNNVTLGLLVALVLIIVLNEYSNFAEGMENMSTPDTTNSLTVGEENVPQTGAIKVLSKDAANNAANMSTNKKISELKEQAAMGQVTTTGQATTGQATTGQATTMPVSSGVDKTDIATAIMSKPSNSIPIDKAALQNSEVNANSSGSTLTEGFSAYAAAF